MRDFRLRPGNDAGFTGGPLAPEWSADELAVQLPSVRSARLDLFARRASSA